MYSKVKNTAKVMFLFFYRKYFRVLIRDMVEHYYAKPFE